MKTFSIAFYKRLILTILALLIIVPICLAVFFGVKSARLAKQLAEQPPQAPSPGETQGEQQPEPGGAPVGAPTGYQLLYPELYSGAELPQQRVQADKTVYLTFDSAPGENTRDILAALEQAGVKATFFVEGCADEDAQAVLREIAAAGHTVGLSSYSGSYETIYWSIESYLQDFRQIYQQVLDVTGVKAEIFRFPGGSVNAYNSGIYQELIAEMLRRGFVFFDWNASGGDTRVGEVTAQDVRESVVSGVAGKSWSVVKLNDAPGKEMVAQALPDILADLREQGYDLQPLSTAVMPVIFSYNSAP